ncbi:hypothetical protein L9F63_023823 [Diploptera punctata]|uniref:Chitin-binding type-2 domain-containing protein n=1 Tax=Diploptera punctata TaxID=6984 RepID=A0AAD7ZIF5_DIPPU|nr:hypothetical protein L9F63_023823 [Diploptera punctata]
MLGLLLLLFVAGTDGWTWGSVKSCPPGEEPQCPKNPTHDIENYFPHPTDCHYYIQCDGNGKAQCEHNATTRQSSLLPPICVPDRDEESSEINGTIILPEPCEDAIDCNYYYRNCTERTQCPSNQHFNKKLKRCEDKCIAGCMNPSEIPECRQCPQEGEIINYQCEYYMVCINGVPEQVKCKSNEHFDVTAKKCIPGSCCEDKPDPKNCSFYITNCAERKQCPPDQHYSKKNKQCENVCTAGCQNPENILQCRECEFEGEILKHNCEGYIMCRNGKAQIFKCAISEHFDEKAGKCLPGSCCEDQPDLDNCGYYITNCNQRVSCPRDQHFNKLTKKCENACTAGCQDPLKIPQCRECRTEGIINSDCHYYTICRNGKPEHIKCSITEHFDEVVKKCLPGSCCEDKPDTTDCGYYLTNCDERVACPANQHFNRQTKHCENLCTAGCQSPLEIPQCQQRQCTEGEILQYDCQHYSICKNGQLQEVKCKTSEHFDVTAGKCIPGSCCEDKPDANDCGYYITNCDQRVACPPKQHFNRQTKRCEYLCTAGCQNPLKIPECRQCQEGQILQYDCQFYTVCRNGKPEEVKCGNNQRFDVTAQRCVPGSCCEDKPDATDCGFYITNCNQRVPCPPNTHYNKQTKRCEDVCVAGCQNPSEIPRCRKCQEGQILQYECQYYTICKNGKSEQIQCSVGQRFDVTAQRCVPGSCCEDKPDATDCGFYITNCNQRVPCPPNTHYNKTNQTLCEDVCVAGCQNPSEIPRCRKCQEGQILQYECQYYTICKNGKSEQIQCSVGQRFDVTAQRCVPGSCCEDKPDATDCGFYITNCNQRVPCPPNTHYNKQTKRCEDVCVAGCQNPSEIPRCRKCQEGQILQYECQYYTICKNGKSEQIQCSVGQRFDVTAQRCVPGSCCEDKPDATDCGFYITNCNQRVPCPPNTHYNKQTKRCEDVCVAGCQNPLEIPRCRNCQEGQILQYECQYYTICKNGKSEQIQCSIGQRFDVTAQRCVPGSCCEDKPDPHDCSYYITNCNQRIACPSNQHFNSHTRKCENVCTAGCQNPQQLPECNKCIEGKILQSDCQNYVICRNGIPEQVRCKSNERFDINARRCVPGSCCQDKPDPNDCSYYITNCNQRTACPPNQHYNKYNKRCEDKCVAGCIDATQIPDCRSECEEGKTYEDPCSCDMYYICQNGKKVLTMCHEGLHYNRTLSHCDAPCADVCVKLFARNPECCASTKGKPEPNCSLTKLPVFLPHPSDSRWFYQCIDGVLYCNRCPPGHRWNTDADTCENTCLCP